MSRQTSSLRSFVITRLLLLPLTLWVVSTFLFVLLRITGDPIDAALGPRASEAAREQMRQTMGLTGTYFEQYVRYMGQLLHFDLGTSLSTAGKPVWSIIGDFFPASLELAIAGLIVALTLAIPFGLLAATRPGSPIDTATRTTGILTYAIPVFWIGMLLQLIFGVFLGWFPIGSRLPPAIYPPPEVTGLFTIDAAISRQWGTFWAALHHLAMPAFTLGLVLSGVFARMIRVHMLEVLDLPFIAAARAKGLAEWRVTLLHAGRNALVPILTVIGLALASLMGGALLTEVTFSWPGLASRLVLAIGDRDYYVVQGLVVFFASIVVTVSLLLDILNAYIDPRIRY